jgi:hypothetical protein
MRHQPRIKEPLRCGPSPVPSPEGAQVTTEGGLSVKRTHYQDKDRSLASTGPSPLARPPVTICGNSTRGQRRATLRALANADTPSLCNPTHAKDCKPAMTRSSDDSRMSISRDASSPKATAARIVQAYADDSQFLRSIRVNWGDTLVQALEQADRRPDALLAVFDALIFDYSTNPGARRYYGSPTPGWSGPSLLQHFLTYRTLLLDELHDFLCSDSRYMSERESAATMIHAGPVAISIAITEAISPNMPDASVGLSVLIAVMLYSISNVGLDAWCTLRFEDRRLRELAPANDETRRPNGDETQ